MEIIISLKIKSLDLTGIVKLQNMENAVPDFDRSVELGYYVTFIRAPKEHIPEGVFVNVWTGEVFNSECCYIGWSVLKNNVLTVFYINPTCELKS